MSNPKLNFLSPTSSKEGTEFKKADFKDNAPFQAGHFKIEPGVLSTLDCHAVRECWLMVSGRGILIYDEIETEVVKGDFLYFDSNKTHQIRNTGTKQILIYSIYWSPNEN